MPNRLANETSPYLLQHKENPVDWYPWGEEAIQKARKENKPIFLSIGYSACHWCHVMEHESFEDEAIAAMMNENFVCVKVDREERPDLDQIYMNAVQMLTGRGGWPMSVFLTPDLKPFYGGTYWPPRAARGMPGFDQILTAVSSAWTERNEQALEGAEQLTAELKKISLSEADADQSVKLSAELIDNAVRQFERSFDATYGGFGGAPKFPQATALRLLLRDWKNTGREGLLNMVQITLDRMAAGGIYDHLGGGFARYSVDNRWLVPHFEKMLYDNAQLAGVYMEAHLATGDEEYARVVRETLDYVLRDMTDPAGGFYSTEDADSEGEEGLFYTWTPGEIEEVLGSSAATFNRVYDVTDGGNFEGRSILNLPKSLSQTAAILNRDEAGLRDDLARSREKLFAAREKRIRPGRDDKVLVSWNGLMIDTMARAGAGLDDPRYVQAAVKAADFLLTQLRRSDGRLLHTWRNGQAKLDAYLDDYACLCNGLVSVYEATFDERWIQEAVQFAEVMLDRFADKDGGGFFFTADDHEQLITRTKEITDASTPSGNGMAATALLRLGKLLGNNQYLNAAVETLQLGADLMQRAPLATGQLLLALGWDLGPAHELILLGEEEGKGTRQVLLDLRGRYLPYALLAARAAENQPWSGEFSQLDPAFQGKQSLDGEPTLYVCENFSCQEPAVGAQAIRERLNELGN